MYKYSTNDLPGIFNDYLTKRSDIHGYHTRHVNDLNLTKNKKHFSDHSVRTSGPILWNNLEKKIKSVKSVKQFRNQYQQNLISNYNYVLSFGHSLLSCLLVWLLFVSWMTLFFIFALVFSFCIQGKISFRPYWPSSVFLHIVLLLFLDICILVYMEIKLWVISIFWLEWWQR